MTIETRRALEAPASVLWHDGAVVVDLALTLERVGGAAAVESLFHRHVARSMPHLMRPLIRLVTDKLGDRDLLFAHTGTILNLVMKGISYDWRSRKPGQGSACITYFEPIHRLAGVA